MYYRVLYMPVALNKYCNEYGCEAVVSAWWNCTVYVEPEIIPIVFAQPSSACAECSPRSIDKHTSLFRFDLND